MSNVAEQKQKKEKMCVMQQKHLGRQADCVTIRLDVSLCVTTNQNDSQDNCQVHLWGRSFINSGQEEKKFILDPRLSSFKRFRGTPTTGDTFKWKRSENLGQKQTSLGEDSRLSAGPKPAASAVAASRGK